MSGTFEPDDVWFEAERDPPDDSWEEVGDPAEEEALRKLEET